MDLNMVSYRNLGSRSGLCVYFRSGLSTSALCMFDKTAIDTSFNGNFKYRDSNNIWKTLPDAMQPNPKLTVVNTDAPQYLNIYF